METFMRNNSIKNSLSIPIIRLNTNDTKLKFNTCNTIQFNKFIFLITFYPIKDKFIESPNLSLKNREKLLAFIHVKV